MVHNVFGIGCECKEYSPYSISDKEGGVCREFAVAHFYVVISDSAIILDYSTQIFTKELC